MSLSVLSRATMLPNPSSCCSIHRPAKKLWSQLQQIVHSKSTVTATSANLYGNHELPQKQHQQEQEELEWKQRCTLAACYRISYLHDWHENIFNHITVKVANSDDFPNGPHFFINEFGVGFDEITASSIVKIDLNGNSVDDHNHTGSHDNIHDHLHSNNQQQQRSSATTTTTPRIFKPGFVIHSAIHQGRPDLHAVWHVHALDTSSVTITQHGLLPISQEAILAEQRGISYHPFEGTANDESERHRLVSSLGHTNQILLLQNHGPLVASPTLHQAFAGMYMLSRACTYQVKALASVGGQVSKLHIPNQDMLSKIRKRAQNFHQAPQQGIQHDSDLLMFQYAKRHAERAFGANNIYQ